MSWKTWVDDPKCDAKPQEIATVDILCEAHHGLLFDPLLLFWDLGRQAWKDAESAPVNEQFVLVVDEEWKELISR